MFAEDARPRPEIATVAWVGDFVVGIPTPGFEGGNYRDADYGTDEADARLIAAAPDLLAALVRILNVVAPDKGELWAFGSAVEQARAAITKATVANMAQQVANAIPTERK